MLALICADEAAVNVLTTYRTNGWSLTGLWARKRCCFVRGTRYVIPETLFIKILYTKLGLQSTFPRYSMLPALTVNGVIYSHIKMGAYNGDQFLEWLEGLLEVMNPYPAPNSVLVLDNCRIHHVESLSQAARVAGWVGLRLTGVVKPGSFRGSGATGGRRIVSLSEGMPFLPRAELLRRFDMGD